MLTVLTTKSSQQRHTHCANCHINSSRGMLTVLSVIVIATKQLCINCHFHSSRFEILQQMTINYSSFRILQQLSYQLQHFWDIVATAIPIIAPLGYCSNCHFNYSSFRILQQLSYQLQHFWDIAANVISIKAVLGYCHIRYISFRMC